jgi:hypothetical protein
LDFPPNPMTKHEWREREGNSVRIWRVTFHGARWAMQSKLKSDPEWRYHEPMSRSDLELLRDLLWRKYQRGRLPFKQIEQIDKMIEDLDEESAPPTDGL